MPDYVKIAVVEDDPADQEALKKTLTDYSKRTGTALQIKTFSNGSDFLFEWPSEYDFIFLDILMEPLDGMETAMEIRKGNPQVPILFLTDSPQFALQSYSVHAAEYLLKPITPALIEQALERLLAFRKQVPPQVLTVRGMEGISMIPMSDISYIEYKERKSWIHTENRVVVTKTQMQDLEKQLPDQFLRIHSAFIVNLAQVRCLKGYDLMLKDTILPISKYRKQELVHRLSLYFNYQIR